MKLPEAILKSKLEIEWRPFKARYFFPGKDKISFVLYKSTMKYWDGSNQNEVITIDDVNSIITDIQTDFSKGRCVVEIEY